MQKETPHKQVEQIKQEHRKRCRRWNHPCHAHALTFSCYRQRPFLKSEAVCEKLARSLTRACIRHDVALWAYVFMPEHVHLLVWPRQPEYSISTFLLSFKLPVSRWVLRYHKQHQTNMLEQMATGQRKQPYRFWQAGGGYDRNIVSKETAWNEIHYIHQNPVRRNLADHPSEWYYSSYKDWMTDEKGPIEIDNASYYIGREQANPPRPSTA
jgi:putative transposase